MKWISTEEKRGGAFRLVEWTTLDTDVILLGITQASSGLKFVCGHVAIVGILFCIYVEKA